MVMGDLVLLDTEVNPVVAKLLENGIDITAVHNHLLRAGAGTLYMHVGGYGDPVKFATAIGAALPRVRRRPELRPPRQARPLQSISTPQCSTR
jgi:hypothetical protein